MALRKNKMKNEDRGESLLTDPVQGTHVSHQVVVTEGGAALREAKLSATRGFQLGRDGGEVPRG